VLLDPALPARIGDAVRAMPKVGQAQRAVRVELPLAETATPLPAGRRDLEERRHTGQIALLVRQAQALETQLHEAKQAAEQERAKADRAALRERIAIWIALGSLLLPAILAFR
jgi:hypothetical protein